MARRKAYTKIKRISFVRPGHVAGMGDQLFRGFQCLNPQCTNFLFAPDDDVGPDFSIECEACGFIHKAAEATKVYDYELLDERDGKIVESGPFEVLHDDYVSEAQRFKYCIVCGALKPIVLFDMHSARRSGRQGECNLCKQVYNSIKNQTRLVEQHREASQKRRLYTQFEEPGKLSIETIYKRFGHKCFKCGVDLSEDMNAEITKKLGNLDHTLPVFYLWPLTTDNATLLCRKHNGEKAEKWPGAFYTEAELRKLAALTGIEYRVLVGSSEFNPAALEGLKDGEFVERLFEKFARYPDELLRLRNRILAATGFDFLKSSAKLSPSWTARAEELRGASPSGTKGTDDE
jgi:hypothetical protein